MRYIVWIISSVNIYFGLYYFLNAIHVLQSSKYSQTSTTIFAVLFLGMGISGFYLSLINNNNKLALLAGIGPWVISLLILLFNMITADYK